MADMLADWTSSMGARLLSSTGEASENSGDTSHTSAHDSAHEGHHDVSAHVGCLQPSWWSDSDVFFKFSLGRAMRGSVPVHTRTRRQEQSERERGKKQLYLLFFFAGGLKPQNLWVNLTSY